MDQNGKHDVPTGVHTWLLLWKATRAVEARAFESIAGTGLGDSDFGVLEALLHKGPLPVNALGRKLLLTTGSSTQAVDRLVKRGLVSRSEHATDRRVRMVDLTPEGRRLIEPAFAQHAADLEQLVAVLTPDERSNLANLLRKLGTAAAEQAEQWEEVT